MSKVFYPIFACVHPDPEYGSNTDLNPQHCFKTGLVIFLKHRKHAFTSDSDPAKKSENIKKNVVKSILIQTCPVIGCNLHPKDR